MKELPQAMDEITGVVEGEKIGSARASSGSARWPS